MAKNVFQSFLCCRCHVSLKGLTCKERDDAANNDREENTNRSIIAVGDVVDALGFLFHAVGE